MKLYMSILTIIACLGATTFKTENPGRPAEIKIHDINQVEMCVSNFGKFGQTQSQSGNCWWPKGSGNSYIFGAGVWFGTIDSLTGDTLVTICYGPHGAESEVVPGLKDISQSHPDAIIYMYPETWPPPDTTFPMAPQEAVSDQDSWACFNDLDSTAHVPGDTRPIGLEFYQTVYVWDEPYIDDVVFMLYQIKNVSECNLDYCYAGVCVDADIGYTDQNTAILQKYYFIDDMLLLIDDFGYHWGYQDTITEIGAIGFDLLQTPFDLVSGQDKDSDGIPDQYERDSAYYWNNIPQHKWDVDNDGVPDWRDASENPQLGMTAFKRFTLDLEPNKDNERYMTLAGYNFRTGQYEPFDTMPDPQPDDCRFLSATGPFALPRDSTIVFMFAVVLAEFNNGVPPAETCLVISDHWAQWQYDMSWFLHVAEERSRLVPKTYLVIGPNPVRKNANVTFTQIHAGRVSLKLYNIAGQVVRTIIDHSLPRGDHAIPICTDDLAQGTYILVLETGAGKDTRTIVKIK